MMNRRDFLRKTTAGAALAACPTIISCSAVRPGNGGRMPREAIPASERIVMGFVGIGWQGADTNLKNFLNIPEAQVVAVCDVDREHLLAGRDAVNKKYGNKDCATYRDFREMYARGDLDAVCLSLPDHWHAIPAIAAARAGMDIFGEKPLSHTLKEGRAMCDAVHSYGRIWQTGSWQRSLENFHRGCELVRNGRIGKVYRVEVGLGKGRRDYAGTGGEDAPATPPENLDYETWLGPAPWAPYRKSCHHKNWRWVLDYGGGGILDWVGHHVDIAHWGLGLEHTGPVEIEGRGEFPTEGVWDAPHHYDVTCRYANGIEMHLAPEYGSGTKWIGDAGWIQVGRGKLKASDSRILAEKIGPEEIRLYRSRDHWQNLIDCIKSRRETITPIESAHRSASVGHLGQIAMLTGRKLRWDPVKEEILLDEGASVLLGKSYREPWLL